MRLMTENEMLDIVDGLIRDRAFNRPAAIAIGMAIGAAVEAEVRERCAKLADAAAERTSGTTAVIGTVIAALAREIRGPNV